MDNVNIVGSYPDKGSSENSFLYGSSKNESLYGEGSENIVHRSKRDHDRNNGIFTKDLGKSDNSYYDEYPYRIGKFY